MVHCDAHRPAAGGVSRDETGDKAACFIGIVCSYGAALVSLLALILTQKARLGNSAVRIKDGSSNFLFWGYKSGSGNTKWGQLLATPLRFVSTRVGTLKVATIYLQLIQNRYMFRSFTVLQCSHQHCVQPVASNVEVVGYL